MYQYTNEDRNKALGYTDLACERYKADTSLSGVAFQKEETPAGTWERIKITSLEGAKSIGRPMGIYNTLHTEQINDFDEEMMNDVSREISTELISLFNKTNVSLRRILIAGLGNSELTPDAVGSLTAKGVRPTLHIKSSDERLFSTLECSEIAVLAPGVAAQTGLDSLVILKSVCEKIKPNAVIAIDALAARNRERLGKTIQLSSTGIIAGGGLENHGTSINEDSLGVPVFSIGVPTVISEKSFCPDKTSENSVLIKAQNRKSMFLCPKEISEIVSLSARTIADGINLAFGLFV